MIITSAEASRTVLAVYRHYRSQRIAPLLAMHFVRDDYATLISECIVQDRPPESCWVACYIAAERYLVSIRNRRGYWKTGHYKGRTWAETHLRQQAAKARSSQWQ